MPRKPTPLYAPGHQQAVERGSFFEACGVIQPSPAPRFSATPSEPANEAVGPGTNTDEVLAEIGYADDDVRALRDDGVVS